MPRPGTLKGPNAYADIIDGLNKALTNGAIIDCGTTNAAIKLVQRFNQFRILDRRLNHEFRLKQPLPGGDNPLSIKDANIAAARRVEVDNRNRLMYLRSKYDALIFRRNESVVLIERRPDVPWKSITDLDGNPIEVKKFEPFDPYEDIADREYEREHTRIEEMWKKEQTKPPREKFNPTKPLNLMGDEE